VVIGAQYTSGIPNNPAVNSEATAVRAECATTGSTDGLTVSHPNLFVVGKTHSRVPSF